MTNSAPILMTWAGIWTANHILRDIALMPWDKVPSKDDTLNSTLPAANPPYACFRVIPGKKQTNSSTRYVQSYKVELKIFVSESSPDLQDIADEAGRAYDVDASDLTEFTCLLVQPSDDAFEVAPEEYQGVVLQTTTLRWLIVAQQQRGT